ncbi:MAG: fibronectin type III domain-containing protein [Candidatus Pacebacteria bacterium]|nr:fibronectin type III domain-containing protein [Candidatus Paceibacterota bacterium]
MITVMKHSVAMFLIGVLSILPFRVVLAVDQDAPDITGVEVTSVTENSVTITWETDEVADSAVNYGLQPDYGIVRIPVAERTEHSITLENLEPGRVYYFRVVSADENGNQGISADYRVQMSGTPQSGTGTGDGNSESQGEGQGAFAGDGTSAQTQTESQTTSESQTQSQTVQEIMEQIEQITDPKQLQEIVNETVKAIQGITEDLTIVGPPTVIPETTTAIIRWTTDREASSKVLFSPSKGFDGTNYAYAQESTQGNTTEHEVQLIGLTAFTDYSFKVMSTDTYNITGESRNFTFQTKATMPEIRNLRVLKVEENAATLAWDTNVPTKALVEYQDQTTGDQQSVGRPTLSTTHQMRLADLTLGTRYVAFVTAENSGGDRVRSQPIQFITVRDIAPPIITNVTNESTLFPGGESRIQTIVEWDTDEPSYCLMTYQEGVAGATEAFTIEKELVSYNTSHVEVIVDFAPATVYQFYLTCSDESGNDVKSENFVLFTPIQEKNIIDLILENFQSTFGWVKNIGA